MTLTPASSLAPSTVTVAGIVSADVTDRAARLLGHVTVDNPSLAVTGPMTDAEFSAHLPLAVTGPLTDAQLAARLPLSVNASQVTTPWVVDASGSTVPVSVDTLPLPDGAATEASAERAADSLDDVGLTAILEREKIAE